MPILKMSDLDLTGKRVLIREDLNVPLKDGVITGDQRILASLPTIKLALEKGAAVILMSHLGRPKEGEFDSALSLAPVAKRLSELLECDVPLVKDYLDGVEVQPGQVVLLENLRFNIGEKKDNEELGKKLAALCDVYVMDAFATAHRAQASTHAVAKFADIACAGPLLVTELDALNKALENPEKPLVAIVSGAKVSTKFKVLDNLLNKVDRLIVGGGIANTFIAAAGFNVGKSLYEPDFVDAAKDLLVKAKEMGAEIPLPQDVVVAKEFSETADPQIKSLSEIADDDMILDFGPATLATLTPILLMAKTIVWNGPVGVFEIEQFANGTRAIAEAVTQSEAFSIAGGGDTVAALEKFDLSEKMSYISTAGGAFLELLEGAILPAVEILQERGKA